MLLESFFLFCILPLSTTPLTGKINKKDWSEWKSVAMDTTTHGNTRAFEVKGYPKSGTTWLEYMLFSILQVYCESHFYDATCTWHEEESNPFFRMAYAHIKHKDVYVLVNPKKENTKHGLPNGWYWTNTSINYRYVVIVRDPRANVVSAMYWSHSDTLIKGDFRPIMGHIKYVSEVYKFMNEHDQSDVHQRIYMIQYEYMLTYPRTVIRELSAWMGIPLMTDDEVDSAADLCSAERMRQVERAGNLHGEVHEEEFKIMDEYEQWEHLAVKVRSASVDSWKQDMPINVSKKIVRMMKDNEEYPIVLKNSYLGNPEDGLKSSYETGEWVNLNHYHPHHVK